MNTWDEAKHVANLAKHGLDFAVAEGFDWDTALTAVDERRDYGEGRFISIGYIGPRLHVMVWTPRGDDTRIIGLRKANDREERRYHAAQA
ncbi:BrnT family toxin (plasmid) [Skermanella sp. TT6]|uniref:BrnT family toxin n=1 Tax=Skermanella cutis TaxID=2775420 RepID=A0ABX7BF59_9PROT|nr:BrnT family toxin [Skermanella sp. TT6]QQP93022.1 BrnT family toxin [Skermanella sp. TT6]